MSESKRRKYEGLSPLVPEIRALTKTALGARGFAGTDIIECWEDMIGSDLSKGAQPEKLVFEKNNRTHGTLHVRTAGGAFAMLFEHQKERVIARINAFFGYPAVSHIKITQGALKLHAPKPVKIKPKLSDQALKELNEKVSVIEDEALRETTFEIGKAILEKKA